MTIPEFMTGSFFLSVVALWVSIFVAYYGIRTRRKIREFHEAVALWNRENAHLFEKPKRGSYQTARGIFEWQEGDEPAEVTVRRMRGYGLEDDDLWKWHVAPATMTNDLPRREEEARE